MKPDDLGNAKNHVRQKRGANAEQKAPDGRQVRLFTNWRLTAATKQRTPDDADMCSLCALKMLLADQEVLVCPCSCGRSWWGSVSSSDSRGMCVELIAMKGNVCVFI